jgi:hypothetical protein
MNSHNIEEYITNALSERNIRYETHVFESGAVMIDIWYHDSFYVVQIDDTSLGVSKIEGSNPGFDTIPDELFDNDKTFMDRFNQIFSH